MLKHQTHQYSAPIVSIAAHAPPGMDINSPPTDLQWVTVKTTLPKLPLEPSATRPCIITERLLLRPVKESDAEAIHEMRTQPEVMVWTSRGTVDTNMDDTRKAMANKLPPNDTSNFDFAICIAETGQLIGVGGVFQWTGNLGWPDIGYMLRKEAWGKGYGSEFLRAFLPAYWALDRNEVEHRVERDTVSGEGGVEEERISATTVPDNNASQNVLKKNGLRLVKIWKELDSHGTGEMIALLGFIGKKPEA